MLLPYPANLSVLCAFRQISADRSEGGEGAAARVVAADVVVAAGGVGVAALVGGDHHAAVLRQPLHALLHAAVAVGAPVVAPVGYIMHAV